MNLLFIYRKKCKEHSTCKTPMTLPEHHSGKVLFFNPVIILLSEDAIPSHDGIMRIILSTEITS